MRAKHYLIFLFLLAYGVSLPQSLSSKQIHLRDSLKSQLVADSTYIYRFQRYRPYINIDQRNSYIRGQAININGLQLGLLINEKHVIGFGGYAIAFSSKKKLTAKDDKNIPITRSLNMDYGTFFYQYVALDKRYWEIDLQCEIGGGVYDYKNYNYNTGDLLPKQPQPAKILVGGLGPLLAFKPTKWIGIIVMVGYRFTSEKNANLNFNGLYYSYGVWFDVRQMIRDYKYRVVKKRKYREALKAIMLTP
jgi:hypothetical protein